MSSVPPSAGICKATELSDIFICVSVCVFVGVCICVCRVRCCVFVCVAAYF